VNVIDNPSVYTPRLSDVAHETVRMDADVSHPSDARHRALVARSSPILPTISERSSKNSAFLDTGANPRPLQSGGPHSSFDTY
jgi:hypothetical protein